MPVRPTSIGPAVSGQFRRRKFRVTPALYSMRGAGCSVSARNVAIWRRSSSWITSTFRRASSTRKPNSSAIDAYSLQQRPLVGAEALVDVVAELHVHARLPVVHPARLEHAPDQGLFVDAEVEHQVRRDAEAVQLPDPRPIDAADARPRERGEDVAVGQHDEAGLERRDDFLLEPIGEVGRVEQHEGQLVERVALLGEVDGRRHQLGSRPAGLDHAVALDLEPLAQQRDLRRAPDAVGALDGDDLARVVVDRQIRDAVSVVAGRA